MNDARVGSPQWILMELVAERGLAEPEAEGKVGEININLFPQLTDDTLDLSLRVEAEMAERVHYVVHIVGRWEKPESGGHSDVDLKTLAMGYRLDELTAAVNFELAQLAARFGTEAPYVPQEQLDVLRKEARESSAFE